MHKKGKSRGQGEGKNSEASIIHVGIDSFQMLGQQEIIRHISMPVKKHWISDIMHTSKCRTARAL